MRNIRKTNWSKENLYRRNFKGYCSHMSISNLSIKIFILSILFFLSGILSEVSAIFAVGLRGIDGDFIDIIIRILVSSLSLLSLAIVVRQGFFVFLGLGISTFVVLGFLLLIFNRSGFIDIFSSLPFTVTSELLALWLSGLAFASIRALSKKLLFPLSCLALLGAGATLYFVIPLMAFLALSWIHILIATSIIFTGGIIGWNAFNEDTKFSSLAQLAINFTSIGGDSFRQANLTEANFSNASLKHSDFRGSNLTRTFWRNSDGLEFARLGNTYLSNPQIRQLVVSLEGQGQNFDGVDLTGVNLQGANLRKASFIGANLNHSNLRNVDLTEAILKQTQLDNTDLTKATLTGACIEDWGITSATKLENVICKYIYMRQSRDSLRKPDNLKETFADGEFADFIKPYFDTLDLYHSQDVDPRAISIALKNLSANHPEEKIDFVAMERRGNNGLNLRFTTTDTANKSDLSHEYFTDYNRIKNELPVSVQIMLSEKTAEIRSLKDTIEQFIKTGTYQSIVNANNLQVIQSGAIMTENKGININPSGNIGDISGLVGGDVTGVVNLGAINGNVNVTNAINQLPDTTESGQPSLKELLIQLQQAIQNDGELSQPDKDDLLEQVQALAEAKHVEEPVKKEGLTRKAMKMFNATLQSLPDTAKIVEACSKLLPMVLKALGFPS
jgi:uncharacterized protein YjbI with pentapeptide repeats